ncbi:hypothetical protein D7030_10215 [Flavobacteriaceae bacterium AU392]|nr:hypothetical protein D1817_06595 [Flavobacteriaceae bacterium]RKM83661.1 hypothetical protein D7030_10215 [Flavobacteriaceae bacterium AU392]
MQNKFFIILSIFLLPFLASAQEEKQNKDVEEQLDDKNIIVKDLDIKKRRINPLAPSKAAFYSAILPGLGQAYNKQYWKIPIVYAAIGTGVAFYISNNNEFNRYRDAFKRRLAGFSDDEFFGTDANGNPLATPRISQDGLIRAQDQLSRNRDLALIVTIGIYALNIIEANVSAHLLSFNIDENLALKPHFKFDERDATTSLGLTLDFKF